MFGKQPWHALCEYATHGIERSKDHDSISGVRLGDGRLQGLHGVGKGLGTGVFAGVLGLPLGLQGFARG